MYWLIGAIVYLLICFMGLAVIAGGSGKRTMQDDIDEYECILKWNEKHRRK